jgi:hypothetical protein
MDVARSLVLRMAAVPLAFVIVLAVAPETRAQFHPDSDKTVTGLCTGGPVPIFITNGLVSPIRYVENVSTGCTVTLQCYSAISSTSCGSPIGPAMTLLSKPFPPFRAFGFACPPTADAICLTPIPGGGTWRLQADYPVIGGP